MKHIYVNFKRFDVPVALGGVNRLAPVQHWAAQVVGALNAPLAQYPQDEAAFTFFFPEAHLLAAAGANAGRLVIGCQGVHREDVAPGGNFGAFTSLRPAAAARALGCGAALVGHCEERRATAGVLAAAGATDPDAVSRLLNQALHCAIGQGLQVLYCVGEAAGEEDDWQQVLRRQLALGLDGADTRQLVIAYEPVWAIGPGKTPPGANHIQAIARFIKAETGGLPVVYGGGLKADNAAMLAAIPEIDGGLIALTRFAGEIGFYPDEYLEIVRLYLGH